jgi:hypothetical protein
MSATVFDKASARRVGRATLEVERARGRGGLSYLYKSSFEYPEEISFGCYIDRDGKLIRRVGWRCVTDGVWDEEVAERDCGTAVVDQMPWMRWTHSIDDETPGAWDEGDNDPPEQDETCMVFIFCKVAARDSGALYVIHRHVGDVRAIDIRSCP